jgi:hypothetical protein
VGGQAVAIGRGERAGPSPERGPPRPVPFCPRIPALKTFTPAVPPLSFMKMNSVSSAIFSSSSFASILPTLSSMFAIMPKNFATSSLGALSRYFAM